MKEEFKKLLKDEGVSNPNIPTESDIKIILKMLPLLESRSNSELDEKLIQEYYKYIAGVLPHILQTTSDIASQSLGKDVISSFNKRIETLNKRYETEKDPEVLKMIQAEISDLYDRIEIESDKQRAWLAKLAFGAMGTAVILGGIAISVKNRDVGKKIVEEGLKFIK